ncbi:DNA polymerase IV [Robiginitalea sediminis]|uniref:DNA polymerase IV n=1 Tax=Robiginitalea sediminis TaxID=1982593 RepID=UPI000B4A7D98|nr:DNA polymerase IV [Robiginitalea sediminis]
MEMREIRKIIHVDMDAFFASVEQHDHPELAGKPVAVGGGSKRGVVAAASYEARKFGVRSAMSGALARRQCPDLIFVAPRFDRYREVSLQIREIFCEYTDLVEPLSLDEAYLDVTVNKKGKPSATLIARDIRRKILEKTGLTASAGISINKFVAKVASDMNKPNGQKTIPPEEVEAFLLSLDIRKFHGVGKVTAAKMNRLGIFTGEDLAARSEAFLAENFGKSGKHYYDIVRGIHNSPVQPSRTPKSVGAERTFSENLSSEVFMLEKLEHIAGELQNRLRKKGRAGKTITLKIKYSDFRLHTRSRTLEYYVSDAGLILETARSLLYQEPLQESVRLLGISLSNLNTEKKKTEPQADSVSVQLQFDF